MKTTNAAVHVCITSCTFIHKSVLHKYLCWPEINSKAKHSKNTTSLTLQFLKYEISITNTHPNSPKFIVG